MTEEQMDDKEQQEEIVTFVIKRTHIYAAMMPVVFLLGLLAGYFVWGKDNPRSVATRPNNEAEQLGVIPGQSSIEEQIATVRRFDIPIEAHDPVWGPEDAIITIIEFSDYECPYCRQYNLEVLPLLREKYAGLIRFVYKNYPLTAIHPNALSAASAAHCAGEQGEYWQFHDQLFKRADELSLDLYEEIIIELGLSLEQYRACFEAGKYSEGIQDDILLARNLELQSTPTFFINGIPLVGAYPYEVFEQILDYLLDAN